MYTEQHKDKVNSSSNYKFQFPVYISCLIWTAEDALDRLDGKCQVTSQMFRGV